MDGIKFLAAIALLFGGIVSAHAECLSSVSAVRTAHGRTVHVTWEHGCYFAGYPHQRKEVMQTVRRTTPASDSRPRPAYSLAGADNQGRRLIDQLRPLEIRTIAFVERGW